MNELSKFFKCECSTHSLEVTKDTEFKQYEFSLWHQGRESYKLSFKERLRWCWRIICTGQPWSDQVILSEKNKAKLIEFLSDSNNKKQLLKG